MELARSARDRWERVVRDPYTLLLAAAAALQLTLALADDVVVRPAWGFVALGVYAVTCVTVAVPRLRTAAAMQSVVPYALLVIAALWRLANRESGSGLGALIVVAVLWIAFHGSRREIWQCCVLGLVALLLPALLTPEGLTAADLGRAAVTFAVAALIAPTISTLMLRTRQAGQQLASQHEIYQQLVQRLPFTTVGVLDEDLRTVTIGGHWLLRMDGPEESYRGWHVTEYFDEADREWALEFYRQGLAGHVQARREIANGLCYELQAMPLTGPRGERLVMSVARDITEEREAERERQEMISSLAVSEASFREAFEGAPIGIALTTVQGGPEERFLRVNPAFAAILGRRPEDLVDTAVADITHPEDVALQPDLSRQAPYPNLRKRFLRPSGRPVWVEVSYTVVHDPDGKPTHIIKQIQDIQTIKQSEHALLDALEQQRAATASLRELDKIRTELVATVSHELRTPLTSIRGYLELLADEPLTGEQRSLLDVAARNTDRLGDLVDDLLVLVRLDAIESVGAMSTSDVTVESTLQAAVDTVRPEITERHQTFEMRLPDNTPVVRGDSDQLDRVLVNLLNNASKYTPAYGHITVDVSLDGDRVLIAVGDNGIGIPLDEQDQLFTRFFRASTARAHSITGNGLGLAIVKTIVERHNGAVSLVSAPDVGTTFTVSLPLAATPVTV